MHQLPQNGLEKAQIIHDSFLPYELSRHHFALKNNLPILSLLTLPFPIESVEANFLSEYKQLFIHSKDTEVILEKITALCRNYCFNLNQICQGSPELEALYNKFTHSAYRNLWRPLPSKPDFWKKLSPEVKFKIISAELFSHVFQPLFNLQDSSWHPKLGVQNLKDSIEKKGPHYFTGYFLNKDSLQMQHGILVKQIKKIRGIFQLRTVEINGEITGQGDEILNYQNFLCGLANQYGRIYSLNQCNYTEHFGFINSYPL